MTPKYLPEGLCMRRPGKASDIPTFHLNLCRDVSIWQWTLWQLKKSPCQHKLDESSSTFLVECRKSGVFWLLSGDCVEECTQARTWGDWTPQTARAKDSFERARVLGVLQAQWEKAPSQRLGQLLSNALLTNPTGDREKNALQIADRLWSIEDFDLASLVCRRDGPLPLSEVLTSPVRKYATRSLRGGLYYTRKADWSWDLRKALLVDRLPSNVSMVTEAWRHASVAVEMVEVNVHWDGSVVLVPKEAEVKK